MANVTFGVPSINKPTPAGINKWVRVATVVIGIFLGWMNTNNLIPETSQDVINSLGGLVLAIINGVAPLFGIDISSTEQVPIEEVKSMDNPKN